jgi:hypothetical protein
MTISAAHIRINTATFGLGDFILLNGTCPSTRRQLRYYTVILS